MPRAPLLTGNNRNFKWVGIISISLFRAVDSALNRATFYLRPDWFYPAFLCIGGRRGSRNHTRFDSLLLVFKTSPLPLGLISHIIVWVFVPDATLMAPPAQSTSKHLSEVCLPKPNPVFSIRSHRVLSTLGGFHALTSHTKDGWQRG